MKLNTDEDIDEQLAKESKRIAEKHYHTLERLVGKSKRRDIYRCIHPDCTYYGPASFLEGKYAICKLCGTRYVLTKRALTLKLPHCGCKTAGDINLSMYGDTTEEQASRALELLKQHLPPTVKSD